MHAPGAETDCRVEADIFQVPKKTLMKLAQRGTLSGILNEEGGAIGRELRIEN